MTYHAYNPQRQPAVSLGAFNLLSMQIPTLGQYLLPNLRSISWELESWDKAPFLRLFLNPELVSVRIEFPDNKLHLYRPATVSLIPTGGLTHLRLEFMGREYFPLDATSNLLDAASETLRSVGLDVDEEPPVAIAEKLLQLPNLRCLEVQLPGTRISPPAVVFPSLEKLVVCCRESDSLLHTLQNIPNPTLRELNVSFSGSSPSYLQTLASSLLGASIERTLLSLDFFSGIPLTEAEIRPLLLFRRLTRLNLSPDCTGEGCNAQFDDSIISELAMALPQLTSLSLGGFPCAATSDVTVTSLVTLSINCVDLDFLRLHLNTTDIITRRTHTHSRTQKFTCKLRTLSVGSQPLPSGTDDILLVTFTILLIFPRLETIESSTRDRSWEQVRRGVRLFHEASTIIPLPTEN